MVPDQDRLGLPVAVVHGRGLQEGHEQSRYGHALAGEQRRVGVAVEVGHGDLAREGRGEQRRWATVFQQAADRRPPIQTDRVEAEYRRQLL